MSCFSERFSPVKPALVVLVEELPLPDLLGFTEATSKDGPKPAASHRGTPIEAITNVGIALIKASLYSLSGKLVRRKAYLLAGALGVVFAITLPNPVHPAVQR